MRGTLTPLALDFWGPLNLSLLVEVLLQLSGLWPGAEVVTATSISSPNRVSLGDMQNEPDCIGLEGPCGDRDWY